jgi:putative redox protein
VAHIFQDARPEIESQGEAEVLLAGRPFRIKKQFLEDIETQQLTEAIAGMRKALLVFHSPIDDVVGIENAGHIFQAAKHPKSFVSLDKADHLLRRKEDAAYVADVIAAWAARYVTAEMVEATPTTRIAEPGVVVVEEAGAGRFANTVDIGGRHLLSADEPKSYGGTDTGPTPYELLMAGLGACKTMTMRMYAERNKLPLQHARVTLRHEKTHAEDCATCETESGKMDRIRVAVEVVGDMDESTRERIAAIAERCPVHRTLKSEVAIESIHQE